MLTLLFAVTAWAQSSLRVSEGLLATQNNTQYSWTSQKITKAADATKLRVTFMATSNNEKPAGFPCVAIAEFYLYAISNLAICCGRYCIIATAYNCKAKVQDVVDGVCLQRALKLFEAMALVGKYKLYATM